MTHKDGRFAVSDVEYNIVTTLSNLLQAEDVLTKYAEDAEKAGASELAALFKEIEESNNAYAGRLRDQLHGLMHH